MAAVLGAGVAAVFIAGIAWLLLGNRFSFDGDPRQNDLLNLGAYFAGAFLLGLALVLGLTFA